MVELYLESNTSPSGIVAGRRTRLRIIRINYKIVIASSTRLRTDL